MQGLHLYDEEYQCDTYRTFLGPNWMDDLAVCVSAPTSDQLIDKLGPLIGTLLECCCNHGMTPNLSPGKTELLLALRGRGSRRWKRHFFGPDHGHRFPVVGEHQSFDVHVVGAYRHLGGIIHHSGSQSREAQQRLAVAHQTFSRHRKLLLQNPGLPLTKRRELFESLVMSAFTYGMESWCFMDQKSKSMVHNGIMKLYKRFLKHPHDAPVTDEQVLASSGLPSPSEVLRRARLRYLGTLYACGPAAEWGLLFSDKAWRELVRDDLSWLWRQLWNSSALEDPSLHFPAWEYLLRYHRGYWKRLVTRGMKHAVQQRKNHVWVGDFHQRVFHHLQEQGELGAKEAAYVTEFADSAFLGCMRCGVKCATRAGEGAHFFKVHGVINPTRYLFDTSQCPACLKEYHTIEKVQAHLRRSAVCREQLHGARRWCRPVPGIGSQQCQEQQRQHDGLVPHLQAQGPQQMPGHRRPFDSENGELVAMILDLASQHSNPLRLETEIRQASEELTISWTDYAATLRLCMVQYSEDIGHPVETMMTIFSRLGDATTWPFLCQSGRERQRGPDPVAHYEDWCARLCDQDCPVWTSMSVPRPVGRERVVLHAFSGRRRQGDYQWFLEKLLPTGQDGLCLFVVSLDIVIDSKYGDLADPDTRGFWLSHIFQGYVHGFLGGPPCCTFSKARSVALEAVQPRRAPRPVRSADDLWGLLSLSLRELDAVMEGNVLLSFCIEAIFALAMMGRQGLLEHPAEPDEENAPSIWKIPIVQLLMRMPNVQKVDFAQGLFGASSRKPTTLLAANSPDLIQILRKWHLTADNPRSVNIGKDSHGQFRTAHLKEYPPALCAALAEATWNATCMAPSEDHVQLPGDFRAVCQRLTVADFGEFLGPDFVH